MMLEVTAYRTVHEPEYQVFAVRVKLNGFDRLTPRAARAALEIAFGQPYGGEVWYTSTDPSGENHYRVGYRVYPKSARKIAETVY